MQILAEGWQPAEYQLWMDEDKQRLLAFFDEQDRTHGYVLWARAETLQEGIGGGNRTHELGQLNCHEEAI
jgi:hypothetical protein